MKKTNKQRVQHREVENDRLLTNKQLARKLGHGFTAYSVNRMRRARQIPVVRIGWRTLRFDLDAVIEALHKRTIKARY